MTEKNLDWYKEALHAAVEDKDRAVRLYLLAQKRLTALDRLCRLREVQAMANLERMYGGHPFPATVSVEEVRWVLKGLS